MEEDKKQRFIKDTLMDQLEWHDRKSGWNQKRYKGIRIMVLIISATIPFLSGLIGQDNTEWVPYLLGGAGVFITVCEGLLTLNKYQENWLNYRQVAEGLRHEKVYYEAQAGPYAESKNPYVLLVERVNAILTNETADWRNRTASRESV